MVAVPVREVDVLDAGEGGAGALGVAGEGGFFGACVEEEGVGLGASGGGLDLDR